MTTGKLRQLHGVSAKPSKSKGAPAYHRTTSVQPGISSLATAWGQPRGIIGLWRRRSFFFFVLNLCFDACRSSLTRGVGTMEAIEDKTSGEDAQCVDSASVSCPSRVLLYKPPPPPLFSSSSYSVGVLLGRPSLIRAATINISIAILHPCTRVPRPVFVVV